MPFPIIPILAWLGIGGCAATLLWYNQLSDDDKAEYNRLATKYAKDLFDKGVDELSKYEAGVVRSRVRMHFPS